MKYCPNCGKELTKDGVCSNCGSNSSLPGMVIENKQKKQQKKLRLIIVLNVDVKTIMEKYTVINV